MDLTLIPMLHVAHQSFYDAVLTYCGDLYGRVPRIRATTNSEGQVSSTNQKQTDVGSPAFLAIIEGIHDSEDSKAEEAKEFKEIVSSPALRAQIQNLAERNELYSIDTLRAMCAELHVPSKMFFKEYSNGVRLQDCYFKPKLVCSYGDCVCSGDGSRSVLGSAFDWSSASSPSALQANAHVIKTRREMLCVDVAVGEAERLSSLRPMKPHPETSSIPMIGEVAQLPSLLPHLVLLWGHYHTPGLVSALHGRNGTQTPRGNVVVVKEITDVEEPDHTASSSFFHKKISYGIEPGMNLISG